MSSPRSEDSAGGQPEAQNFFKLQLRPVEDPENFKLGVQLVAREFASRYLESVGVRPSKATLDLVARNLPLGQSNIRTTLRANGHVEDEIHISVPPVTHQYKVPAVINPAAVLQLTVGNRVMAAEGGGAAAGEGNLGASAAAAAGALPSGHPDQPVAGGQQAGDVSARGTAFLDLAARYLHPFNLDLTLARKNVSALLYATARQRPDRDDPNPRTGTTVVSYGTGPHTSDPPAATARLGSGRALAAASSAAVVGEASGAPGSGELSPEVLEELQQPLLVTPEVILTIQAQLEAALVEWHRVQAPEALKGRLTPEQFARTVDELSGEGTVKLLITLINFLHEEFVRGITGPPARLPPRNERSSIARRQEQLLEDRGLLPSLSGGHAAGGAHLAEGGGGAGSGRRASAHAHGAGAGSTQQMTNLQKYDLGYQAYVAQKLEQAPSPTYGRSQAVAGGAHRHASGQVPPHPHAPAATGGRSTRSSLGGSPPPQMPPGAAADGQRVTFSVAPHYNPHAHAHAHGHGSISPSAPRPGAPGGVGSMLGPLNLPGARSAPASPHLHSSHGSGGVAGASLRSPSPSFRPSSAAGHDDAVAAVAALLGPSQPLHPRVSAALSHSPSFALASAASTARAIHATLNAADTAALQSERLFALHVAFATRFKELRQARAGLFFTLPILLLSMRLCVHTLFSTLYPLWCRKPDGCAVLERMDAALVALFDPHGYLGRALSVLQSTPSAIEAVLRHPQRRGNERRHFADTSPLLQATMGGAVSAGARKLMHSSTNQPAQARGLLRTQLTAEQRAALFQRGLQWMQQPDPVLSQVGDPQGTGRPLYSS